MSPTRDALLSGSLPLIERWRMAWPEALVVWSKFTRLRDARLCESRIDAAQEGLSGSFAMIRLVDQSVVIDLETVRELGLEDYGVEILAHEIGLGAAEEPAHRPQDRAVPKAGGDSRAGRPATVAVLKNSERSGFAAAPAKTRD